MNPCRNYSFNKSLALLGYESKILSLLGENENICRQIGVSFWFDKPVLLCRSLSDVHLKEYLELNTKVNFPCFKMFVESLTDAIIHIHTSRILYNMITETSINMRATSLYSLPVVTNFAYACRIDSSKCLTLKQRESGISYLHLPPDVRNGNCLPSVSSDIFSYGKVVSLVAGNLLCPSKEIYDKLYHFLVRCESWPRLSAGLISSPLQ